VILRFSQSLLNIHFRMSSIWYGYQLFISWTTEGENYSTPVANRNHLITIQLALFERLLRVHERGIAALTAIDYLDLVAATWLEYRLTVIRRDRGHSSRTQMPVGYNGVEQQCYLYGGTTYVRARVRACIGRETRLCVYLNRKRKFLEISGKDDIKYSRL